MIWLVLNDVISGMLFYPLLRYAMPALYRRLGVKGRRPQRVITLLTSIGLVVINLAATFGYLTGPSEMIVRITLLVGFGLSPDDDDDDDHKRRRRRAAALKRAKEWLAVGTPARRVTA